MLVEYPSLAGATEEPSGFVLGHRVDPIAGGTVDFEPVGPLGVVR